MVAVSEICLKLMLKGGVLKINFDHCYQFTELEEQYAKLRKRGFSIDLESMVEHPGARRCQFLHLESSQYLEFIYNSDKEANRERCISEGRSGDDLSIYESGFSLKVEGSLETFYNVKKVSFPEYGIHFTHRNYNWKANSTDKLPGWNFLEFKKDIYPGFYIWLTEYEKSESRKSNTVLRVHENTCTGLIGLLWKKEKEGIKNLASLLDRSFQNPQVKLDDGVIMWLAESDSLLGKEFQGRKDYPFWAVILKCTDFQTFKNVAKPEKIIEFEGKSAGLIPFGRRGWDIIVVEDGP
jgi:hypothetical protein